MERLSKKLLEKYIGPYPIIEVVSPVTYRVELPCSIGNYNVFYTNPLRAAATDPLPGRQHDSRPRVATDPDKIGKEWMIKDILNSRLTKNHQRNARLEYYVRWKGYPASWAPQKNLIPGAEAALYNFHVQHP